MVDCAVLPTLNIPMRSEQGGLATGIEATLTPLETDQTSTGAHIDTFYHLSGLAELAAAPPQELVRREVRGVLASLRRPSSSRKLQDWTQAWQATAWEERPQTVLWPPYTPEQPADTESSGGEYHTCNLLSISFTVRHINGNQNNGECVWINTRFEMKIVVGEFGCNKLADLSRPSAHQRTH